MKPHEIAACVHKMFTEHPENFRQNVFFEDGGFCVLGAATLCVDPDVDKDKLEADDLPTQVGLFSAHFRVICGHNIAYVNDSLGLSAIMEGLEKMIEKGLADDS